MHSSARDKFVERFADLAAESDYSRHPQLRGASEWDIKAAGEALWTYAMREDIDISKPGESMVITAMLAQTKRWDDEGELVSVEFEEYWDATDKLGLSGLLTKDLKRELTAKYLATRRDDFVVVNNRYGIWLFGKDTLWDACRNA